MGGTTHPQGTGTIIEQSAAPEERRGGVPLGNRDCSGHRSPMSTQSVVQKGREAQHGPALSVAVGGRLHKGITGGRCVRTAAGGLMK